MTVNVPLLRQTLDHIREHPQEWDQQTWRRTTPCGSAMCFAGTAAMLAGATWLRPVPLSDVRHDDEDVLVVPPGGGVDTVEGYAIRVLGLTERQAAELFASGNSFPRLCRLVERFTEREMGDHT